VTQVAGIESFCSFVAASSEIISNKQQSGNNVIDKYEWK